MECDCEESVLTPTISDENDFRYPIKTRQPSHVIIWIPRKHDITAFQEELTNSAILGLDIRKELCRKIIKFAIKMKKIEMDPGNKHLLVNVNGYEQLRTLSEIKTANVCRIEDINLIDCGLLQLTELMLKIVTKQRNPGQIIREDSNWCDYVKDCDDIDEESKVLISDIIDRVIEKRINIEGVHNHPFFWTYEEKVKYCVDIYHHHAEKKDDLNSKSEEAALEISVDKYPSFQISSKKGKIKTVTVMELNPRSKLNNMTTVWDLLQFIRNMYCHYNEKKYPERQQWLGVTDDGLNYETFWKNTTHPWPELLKFLYSQMNTFIDENNNLVCFDE